MPRRSEAQRLLDDARNFMYPPSTIGPATTNQAKTAREARRQRREAERTANYQAYRERLDRNNQNRRNNARLQRFLNGQSSYANLNLTTPSQIQRFLDTLLPALERGERFVLNNGDRYFTLTNEKYIDIQNWLTSIQIFGDECSDLSA